MKELKPQGNDIQMTVPHENRFRPLQQPEKKEEER